MLELKQIIKDYDSGNEVVHALRGITLSFRENEFVSILGQSGCGKTTLLNIVGGLDHYTSGDLSSMESRQRILRTGTGMNTAIIPSGLSFRATI